MITGEKPDRVFELQVEGGTVAVPEGAQPELVAIYDQIRADTVRIKKANGAKGGADLDQIALVLAESILPTMSKLAEVSVVKVGALEFQVAEMEANGGGGAESFLDDDEIESLRNLLDACKTIVDGMIATPGIPAEQMAMLKQTQEGCAHFIEACDDWLGEDENEEKGETETN